jgi:hypothetical protein
VEDSDILDTKIIESTFRKYLLGVQMASRGETNANSIWRTSSEIETIKEFSFLPKMFKDSGNEHISTRIGKLKNFSPYSKYERDSKEKFKGNCFDCGKPPLNFELETLNAELSPIEEAFENESLEDFSPIPPERNFLTNQNSEEREPTDWDTPTGAILRSTRW